MLTLSGTFVQFSKNYSNKTKKVYRNLVVADGRDLYQVNASNDYSNYSLGDDITLNVRVFSFNGRLGFSEV
jgi:hypothetical protein